MRKKGWFSDWFNSSYYHTLYQHRDDTEAFQFIDNLLAYLKPLPHATMLDIACGKGRHSKALFDAGFDVTGIDLSPASIEAASNMKTNGLHFFVMICGKLLRSIILNMPLIFSQVLVTLIRMKSTNWP